MPLLSEAESVTYQFILHGIFDILIAPSLELGSLLHKPLIATLRCAD
jgi:hypothetical protein